jgi:hypothetical protein
MSRHGSIGSHGLAPQLGTEVVQARRVQALRSAVLGQRQSPCLRLPKMEQVSPLSSGLLALCRRHRALRPRPIAVPPASTYQITTKNMWFLEWIAAIIFFQGVYVRSRTDADV